MKRYVFIIVAAVLCGLAGATAASNLSGQAITWANFGYVNQVATSMSYVYFATTEGILRYDKLKREFSDPITGTSAPPDNNIKQIWVDRFDKRLYVETISGLYEYNVFLDRWYPINELPELDNETAYMPPPRTLLPPPQFNYSDNGFLIDPYGRRYELTTVANDNEGSLWIGSWGYGPMQANETSNFISILPYGLLQNRVNAIEYDNGLMYIGGAYFDSFRSGVTVFNFEENTFDYIESGVGNDFPRTDINCLEKHGDRLLIGTPLGLYRYDTKNRIFTGRLTEQSGLTDDNVLSLLATGDSVFVGTEDGLTLLTQSGDSAQLLWPQEFVNQRIYDFEQMGSEVWIASSVGAYRLKTATGELQRYSDPELVLFGGVYSITHFGDDLWLASDNGVVRLNVKTGEATPYRENFIRSRPNAIAANETICAVATESGLTIIFYAGEKVFSRTFTVQDGLASNYDYALLMDGDYIWVGTQEGLTSFWWNNPNRVD